jgi:lipoprotein-releasing system permease protein
MNNSNTNSSPPLLSFSLPAFIALRYLGTRKNNRSISFFSGVSLLGISLGLASVIVVLSVMNGFEKEMHKRILGMLPHVSVENSLDASGEKISLENWQELAASVSQDPLFSDEIMGIAPFVQEDGMLNKSGLIKGIRMVGINPHFEKQSTVLDEFIMAGSLSDLSEAKQKLILGSEIAREMGIIVGDEITLAFPKVSGGRLKARYFTFTVAGFFEVGAEADSFLAFVNIEDAAQIKFQSSEIDGFRIQVKDVYGVESLQQALKTYYSQEFKISTWKESHGQLFQTVKIEKVMTASMLMLIVLIAAFNTISSLNMLVAEKHTGIAVLRTMGFQSSSVISIFFLQGLFISGLGVLLGLLLGLLVALNLTDVISWINDTTNFWIAPLKSEVRLSDVFWISSFAFMISLFASILPAMYAAKIQPADAVRYQ